MPCKLNVEKLRAAFLWLKAHNPFYVNIKWDESAAQQWSEEDVAVGITREEDLVSGRLLAVSQEVFERWMLEAEAQQDSPERGFSMGHRLLKLLAQQQEDTATENHWSLLRTLAADLQGQRCIRAASSLPENMIAALMHVHGVVELPVPPDVTISSVTTSRRLRSVKISSAHPACLKKTSVPEKNKRVTNIYGCA